MTSTSLAKTDDDDLIRLAIKNNISDPDALAKIVDLVNRERAFQAEREFTAALRDAQEAMPAVVRGAANQSTGKLYASLDDILPVVKPILAAAGFALSFAEADCPLAGWKRTVCDLRHCGGHSVRYHVDLPLDGVSAKGNAIGSMNPIQAAVSSGTYGQRVLLVRICNLTIADSDADGQSMADLLRISPRQREELDRLIEQEQWGDAQIDKLLRWVKADSLDEITARQFQTIVSTYRQRKAKAGVA